MDNSLGPELPGYFDFTLLFEDIVFHIIPTILVIFATIFFVAKIVQGRRIVRPGWLLWIKLTFAAALIGVQVANAVLWSTATLDSRLSRLTSIITCIGALCIAIIAFANHIYFLRPLPFLGLYLTVTLLADIGVTRTYFRRDGLDSIARLHVSIPVLKALLLILEEISKRSLVISEDLRELGGEQYAGAWNRSLLVWFNSILFAGYRGRLTGELLPGIYHESNPAVVYQEFLNHWSKADRNSSFALVKACVQTTPWPYVFVVAPRLLFIGFKFAQPFLLQDVVNTVATGKHDSNIASGLTLATALVYIGIAISRNWYLDIKNQMMTNTRALLIEAIYHKSLRLPFSEAAKAAAITLINTDMNSVVQLIGLAIESWARVLEIILGYSILVKFIGTASIFSFFPAVISSAFIYIITRRMVVYRKKWNERTEKRVADTSNMLAQFKDIKMIGLAPTLAGRLQQAMVAETAASTSDRHAVVSTFSFSACVETITPVLVIAGAIFWTRASEPITAANLFTTIAVVTMISVPLANILTGLTHWTGAFASVLRIQKYLTQEELEEYRQFLPNGRDHASQVETATGDSSPGSGSQSQSAVAISHMSVTTDTDQFIFQDVSLSIPAGRTTMFTGRVGSGKSTLLKTILGQLKPSNGAISLRSRRVAYCAQKPWIRNATIRDNITGRNEYNEARFKRVIKICALDVDLQRLPSRDMTECGSDGHNLSGGQQSRVAIARAFYDDAEIVVLDDPLSALDEETGRLVCDRMFGDDGLFANNDRTLIMTTSLEQPLSNADVIFKLLGDGIVAPMSDDERQHLSPQRSHNEPTASQSNEPFQEEPRDKHKTPAVKASGVNDSLLSETKFGDFSLYSYFIGPAGLRNVLTWGGLVVLAAIAERMPQIFIRLWLDHAPQNRVFFLGYALFGVFNPVMNLITCGGFFHLINAAALNDLHKRLADTTSGATFGFIATEDAASILNRFSLDTSVVSHSLPLSIIPAAWGAMSVLIDIGIIASGASYAAPILPVMIIFVLIVQHFYLKTSKQLRAMELDSSKLLVRQLSETSAGLEHIRAFDSEEHFIVEFQAILDQTQKPYYYLMAAQQWLLTVLDFFTAAAAVSMVSLAVNFPSTASPTSMGLAFVSLVTFSMVISLFIRYFVAMEISYGAVARIRAYVQGTPIEKDHQNSPPENWPESGKIVFKQVSAAYKDRDNKFITALDEVTVDVEPTQTLGLVGRTGSGKSSMLLAILRLLDYSGTITIDGLELKSVPLQTLRTRITTITQSGLELKGTIRYNLNPFDSDCYPPGYELTNEMQVDVLQRVGLLNLITSRGGLEADMITMNFSHGQKQLFQVARAMLHKHIMNSRVVLVDEGTSSMDEASEEHVRELMDVFFADCTKIFISHRLDFLRRANVVLTLEDGKAMPMVRDPKTNVWKKVE